MQRHRRAPTGLTNWSVMQQKLKAQLKLQPELGPLRNNFILARYQVCLSPGMPPVLVQFYVGCSGTLIDFSPNTQNFPSVSFHHFSVLKFHSSTTDDI